MFFTPPPDFNPRIQSRPMPPIFARPNIPQAAGQVIPGGSPGPTPISSPPGSGFPPSGPPQGGSGGTPGILPIAPPEFRNPMQINRPPLQRFWKGKGSKSSSKSTKKHIIRKLYGGSGGTPFQMPDVANRVMNKLAPTNPFSVAPEGSIHDGPYYPKNKEDYDKIPVGGHFMDPQDNKMYKKYPPKQNSSKGTQV